MNLCVSVFFLILVFGSCNKSVSKDCDAFGANLLPGSVLDTITLGNGKKALQLSTGECRFDTLIIEDNVPDIVDTIPYKDTIPGSEDTVKTVIIGFGSSTIARWDLQTAFPDKTIRKAGYKGSFLHQLLELTDTIRKVKPQQVLLYAGSNDIITGKSVSEVTLALQELMSKIWDENPDVHITYITIHASDTVFKVQSDNGQLGIETLEKVNANMIDWITNHHGHNASVVESYRSFLRYDPKRIDVNYYEPDKLHLNQTLGYPKLNELTSPILK